MKTDTELKKDNTQTHTCCPKCGCVHVGDCKFQLKENEWLPINQKQLPSDRLICEWKHPEYGVITGSLIWDGGKLESEKSWWVFPVGGAEADISLDEFTHYRKIYKPVPDRPTPVVQAKTAEEILEDRLSSEYVISARAKRIAIECMHAYHAQFTPSAKSVEVEEAKTGRTRLECPNCGSDIEQADTISRLRGDMEWIAKFCNDPACKRLAKEALKEKES